MNIKRLMTLIEFMESLPVEAEKHFDMREWTCFLHAEASPTAADLLRCGTTACAAGWAGVIPEFNEEGYSLTSDGLPRLRDGGDTHRWTGQLAAMNFFDMTFDQFDAFFGGRNRDKTPKHWAQRARLLLAGKGKA